MSTTATPSPAVSAFLSEPLTIGAPDVAGPLAVFPLFGPHPRLEYRSFAEASAVGAVVKELPDGASVNDVLVHNPTDTPVLLYEGEELIGAQQNRTIDAAVLVPARSDLQVQVSCVEHGRWDGTRHHEAFSPSAQAAFPSLRAAKSLRMRQNLAAGRAARADQGEVWDRVGSRIAEVGAESQSDAMHDAFEARRSQIDAFHNAIARRDGQLGCLVSIAGEWVVLDHVSRADVFAALHAPLVAGYALDALDKPQPQAMPTRAEAATFLTSVLAAPPQLRPSAGLGHALSFTSRAASGTGLVHEDELIQLSAYVGGDDDARGPGARASRIRRPSRRR